MDTPRRVIALDWSGDLKAAQKKIWLCEVVDGTVRRLESGRARPEIGEHLIAEAERDPSLVVGLDFAFSFPAGFLEKRAHHRIDTVWEEVSRLGEKWLEHCPFPFWGKPGKKKPVLGPALFRRTELEVATESGLLPKSVFQIGGAGAVGVGSLRGMPVLARLRAAGFAIWPFDEPRAPLVIEVWPRLFMGSVRKSNRNERRRFLRDHFPRLRGGFRKVAEESDDAFDALVTALEMSRHSEALARLAHASSDATGLEGEIWRPVRR